MTLTAPQISPGHLAADVVFQLLHTGVIANNRDNLLTIARQTGITHGDIHKARNRAANRGYGAFNIHQLSIEQPPATTPPADERQAASEPPAGQARPARAKAPKTVEERPSGMRGKTSFRKERFTPAGVRELFCTGAEAHPAHWAPEDQFMRRADRPHLRHTHCDDGRKAYQKAHRVTLAVREELAAAGIKLRIDPGSNLIGVVCNDCHQPFVEGDHIKGEALLSHRTCPPGATGP